MLYSFKSPKKTYQFRFDYPKVDVRINKFESELVIKSKETITLFFKSCTDEIIVFGKETEQEFIIEQDLKDNDLLILSAYSLYCGFTPKII